jgi:hypothetical protein
LKIKSFLRYVKLGILALALLLFTFSLIDLYEVMNANYGTLVSCYYTPPAMTEQCNVFLAGVNFQDFVIELVLGALLTVVALSLEILGPRIETWLSKRQEHNISLDKFS